LIRVGAKVPNSGRLPAELGLTAMARRLEDAGFASLWLSDHIVQPETFTSRYPFSPDGKATWPTDDPWYDAIVCMAMIAAVTERVEIGVAVLVLPLRHPIELAKQVASIDALCGGRTVLGVGVGWQAEEFEALAVPFEDRGRRTDEWLELLRACWTGRPDATKGGLYELPADVLCFPTPARRPPLLIGGMSPVAFRRSASADGWLALQPADALDIEQLKAGVTAVRAAAGAPGRAVDERSDLRFVLRTTQSAGFADALAAQLPALAAAGFTDVIVDVDWTQADGPERVAHVLLDAAARPASSDPGASRVAP
jgi:probable F420-dependent oxidoreductase